jgi:hypothetical protein
MKSMGVKNFWSQGLQQQQVFSSSSSSSSSSSLVALQQ